MEWWNSRIVCMTDSQIASGTTLNAQNSETHSNYAEMVMVVVCGSMMDQRMSTQQCKKILFCFVLFFGFFCFFLLFDALLLLLLSILLFVCLASCFNFVCDHFGFSFVCQANNQKIKDKVTNTKQ